MFTPNKLKVLLVSVHNLAMGQVVIALEAFDVGSGFSCWRSHCDQGVFQLYLGMLYLDLINNRVSLTFFFKKKNPESYVKKRK